jgi:hypothetical protein
MVCEGPGSDFSCFLCLYFSKMRLTPPGSLPNGHAAATCHPFAAYLSNIRCRSGFSAPSAVSWCTGAALTGGIGRNAIAPSKIAMTVSTTLVYRSSFMRAIGDAKRGIFSAFDHYEVVGINAAHGNQDLDMFILWGTHQF